MEQTTIHATEDYLRSHIAEKNERILTLEQHIQRVTQRDYATAANLTAMRDQMHTWTTTELENQDITKEQAEAIAEICGFELTNEVEVIVTVEYSMTLNVPAGEDAEDIVNDIDFDAVSYDTDKISYITSSISNIEI
jgi:ribulose 1,5-bisphosphate carboxylase large subunit-like protein